MQAIRVLFVQPLLPSYRVPVFAELAKRGFEVTCWSDHFPSGSLKHVDPAGAFSAEHRKEVTYGPFFSQPGLIEAARSQRFDVLVLPWNVRYLELIPSILWARSKKLPTVLWGHARSKRERASIRALRNRVGRLATACMTYDHGASAELVQEGLDKARVFTAQNAIDNRNVAIAQQHWQTHAEELALFQTVHQTRERPVVLYVSRLEPEKHVEYLLSCFHSVVQNVPKAQLVIVGDGPERAELEARTSRLNLTGHVRFVGAVYEERLLAPWFLAAKAFAYPTHLGLSLLHAMSYGVPVITSNNANEHGPEFFALRDGFNGLTYKSGDLADFSRQLTRCLLEPDLQQALAQQARRTIEAPGGFNLETMVDGMATALRFAKEHGYDE